ncbi:MAG: hypothetical protein ACREQ9_27360 [Candidatus Binatia bacterium]
MRVAAALLVPVVVTLLLLPPAPAAAALPPEISSALAESEYVYIATTRKDGSLGRPAEIWFFFHEGSVYVSSPKTTWRVRRIQDGRPAAKISVGKPEGPSFSAVGEIVADASMNEPLMNAFAKKYPERWSTWAEKFRQQLADGSRVVVRYAPK